MFINLLRIKAKRKRILKNKFHTKSNINKIKINIIKINIIRWITTNRTISNTNNINNMDIRTSRIIKIITITDNTPIWIIIEFYKKKN